MERYSCSHWMSMRSLTSIGHRQHIVQYHGAARYAVPLLPMLLLLLL